MNLRAPAKLNLCLYLGAAREDGLHEILSIFQPLSLADRLVVTEAERDEVLCPGVEGPELASAALAGLRARGWSRPPLRIEVEKRIPIAAGLGGGSADAAAVLRLAAGEVDGIAELAAELGADVPSQLDPVPALVSAAGERVERLPPPPEFAVVLIPFEEGLATAEVYAEAERLGAPRDRGEMERIGATLREAAARGFGPLRCPELLVNDLEPAAISLRPRIADALDALREAGAAATAVTGSGPTAFGIFEDLARADAAASALPARHAAAIVATPLEFG